MPVAMKLRNRIVSKKIPSDKTQMIKQLKRILKPVQRHTKHYQTLIRKSEYDNVGLMTLSRFRRTPEPRVRMGQIMSLSLS
jgi:hypothetical protein